MPTYQKADPEVAYMAKELIAEHEDHESLRERVRIDFVFAFPDYDDATGEPTNDALKHHGMKALGIARKIPPKDRAMGRGDAEICLDGRWWKENEEAERRALLDHELYHLVASADNDDLGRPIIKMRKHDYQFGWFRAIALRHGRHSQECIQASLMVEESGQYLFPGIVEMQAGRFGKLEQNVTTQQSWKQPNR